MRLKNLNVLQFINYSAFLFYGENKKILFLFKNSEDFPKKKIPSIGSVENKKPDAALLICSHVAMTDHGL